MKNKNVLFLFLCLSSISISIAQVLPTFGNSRSGAAGMQFLKIWPDARSGSLGGAVTAIANDPSAAYWNPAGLVKGDTGKFKLQISNSRYFANTNQYWVSAIFNRGKYAKLGLSLAYNDYGSMMETTEFQPFGTGRAFSMNSWTLASSYARILTDFFSFGVNMKWAHEGLAGVAVNNLLFDFGLRYDLDVRNARFAVTINNFGANVQPNGHMSVLKFNGGQSDITSYQRVSVPAVFRLGFAMDAWRGNNQFITGTAQLNHYSDNNETLSIGAEYAWHKLLYLRTGYEFGVDEGGLPSAGFGLKLQKRAGTLSIDYGFCNKIKLGNVHRIGLVWNMR